MASKKELLAKLMFGRFNPFFNNLLSIRKSKRLFVLAYHRVYMPQNSCYPFNEGTISAYPEQFERQMKFISARFKVITFKDLTEIIDSGKEIPCNSLS
jgi:hypothetical protein